MKKQIPELILSIAVLAMAVLIGGYVLRLAVKRNGDIFNKYSESSESASKKNTSSKSKNSSKSDDAYQESSEETGTFWIGDSRFVGMDKAVDIEENNDRSFVVARIGQGLSWFEGTALPQVKKIRAKNTAYTNWRYVICLGVNDLGNIDRYIEEYETLTSEDDSIELILVSVNPVKNYPSITNADIRSFNKKLKAACDENDWYYIDTYSDLMDEGYETTDGLHYTDETYEEIYDDIREGLSDYEKEKQE